ncbi:MAG: NEW3 domain-containing protein [Desulfatiglandales bacterium]
MKVRGPGISVFFSLFLILLVWVTASIATPAFGEENKKQLPARKISVAPEYTGIVVQQGEDVTLDLNVKNGGRQDENIELSVPSIPKGWKARVKTYKFDINGIHLESDSSRSVTFVAEPDKDVEPGKYTFVVKGETQDGALSSSSNLVITVREKEKAEKKAKGLNIVTSYPVLQGPTDAKFEFSIEVESKVDKDTIFNLTAKGPENWEVNFKPAYEQKYISSLRIKANQSTTMAVEVKPYALAVPGEYPINVKISSDTAQAEAEMVVVLTGTHKIEAGTADGLLSLDAFQGREGNISLYVKNTGSAIQSNVRFLSFKPENWKVEFKPEKLESLAPGDLKQVEVAITPAEQALVGDYSVALSVEGEKASKNLEFRVTVKASTAWGWVGIGIIVLVIAGLVTLFIRMGRR